MDTERGLYQKYRVTRGSDGGLCSGRFFVLKYDTDPHARVAVRAYADSVEEQNPTLARDIRLQIAIIEEHGEV
jgi:hypothetical protein